MMNSARHRMQKKLLAMQHEEDMQRANVIMGQALYDEFVRVRPIKGEEAGVPRVLLELFYHALKKHPEILDMELRLQSGKTVRLALEY